MENVGVNYYEYNVKKNKPGFKVSGDSVVVIAFKFGVSSVEGIPCTDLRSVSVLRLEHSSGFSPLLRHKLVFTS